MLIFFIHEVFNNNQFYFVLDYISLELRNGYPLLQICTGTSTKEIYLNSHINKLNDGALHKLKIGSGIDVSINRAYFRCILLVFYRFNLNV